MSNDFLFNQLDHMARLARDFDLEDLLESSMFTISACSFPSIRCHGDGFRSVIGITAMVVRV